MVKRRLHLASRSRPSRAIPACVAIVAALVLQVLVPLLHRHDHREPVGSLAQAQARHLPDTPIAVGHQGAASPEHHAHDRARSSAPKQVCEHAGHADQARRADPADHEHEPHDPAAPHDDCDLCRMLADIRAAGLPTPGPTLVVIWTPIGAPSPGTGIKPEFTLDRALLARGPPTI